MKICFLHHTYPGIGGTETVTNLLTEALRRKDIEVMSVLAWQKPKDALSLSTPPPKYRLFA